MLPASCRQNETRRDRPICRRDAGYVFRGVRPSSAAAQSERSSGSDCPNATGPPCVSAPEDGRTPLSALIGIAAGARDLSRRNVSCTDPPAKFRGLHPPQYASSCGVSEITTPFRTEDDRSPRSVARAATSLNRYQASGLGHPKADAFSGPGPNAKFPLDFAAASLRVWTQMHSRP